jgi:hypothetical protein
MVDMRTLIRIVESAARGRIGDTYLGGPVYRNPSRAELHSLIRASEYGEVRAFLSENLYVWEPEVLHHDFPMDLLAPEDSSCAMLKGSPGRRCVNLHITKAGPYMAAANIEFEDDGETPGQQWALDKTFVDGHPAMRRLFGAVDLKIEL